MSNRPQTRNSVNVDPEPAPAPTDALRVMRERSRAVAEREASRLARPDQPGGATNLGHANKAKSAVMSTPFGQMTSRSPSGRKTDAEVEEEWCGPFSVARQMIAAREEARRLREEQQAEDDPDNSKESHPLDEATELALEKKRRLENPSMNWVSRRQRTNNNSSGGGDMTNANYYAKRRKRLNQQKSLMGNGANRVPSLFHLCVNNLVENFEHIDSLGLVDHSIRRALCERLVAQGLMNGAAFDVLAEMGVETLELVDCAQVTQEQFCDALRVLLPSGLRAILLKHCGRCFGSQAVQVITEIKREELNLFAISLGGAYLLKDEDIAKMIGASSRTLSSIDLTACPLIGTQLCQAVGEHFSSLADGGVNGCLLELSLQNIPLTKEALLSLGASSDALRNLKSLKLKEMEAVDDEVVSIVLDSIDRGSLEGIDLSGNPELTDEILASIRRCNVNGNLRALQLNGLRNLTAIGLEAFFTPIDNLPSPPMLRKLDLSQCSYDEVNDAVLILAAKAASLKRSLTASATEDDPNPESLVSQVSSTMGLVHVNIGSSSVSDKSMEMLAATCSVSLEELDISFCANVSNKGLGYLVSKSGSQLSKLHVWGLAQITEEFLDGHDRVEEGGLEIEGVWMKKSGGASLR
mmetsp:Transcript_20227/g.43977  ORF Transcript_20227/g.43977 Transcript_20227/m.43977 type:complete len:638 (-) Transcript_20227:493-2406(-)|eukprot:CAMPEP_0172326692 /NCGR_PEP_ID=MMETSP1058-20130122/57305_1 /TAXON_ID=83371 /ORGANISM="Detonula confervacea, Strain CCMP 353" /LENGTH=637 /DNA_ID=CAMNT_0013043539 /DNA_START=126 /DNA_END=2042 /DNA_ORIENTATION=-